MSTDTNGRQAPFSQEHLRQIGWDIGAAFPIEFHGRFVALVPVHPRQIHIQWHAPAAAVEELKRRLGHDLHGAVLVVRVYDVTDVIFDGSNAHGFFDIDAAGLGGGWYLDVVRNDRNLLAELGFRMPDGAFHALVRSNPCRVDRDRPSQRLGLEGLYVGRDFRRVFPVQNVMAAGAYERLNLELARIERTAPLAVACLHQGGDHAADIGGRLPGLIDRLNGDLARFKVEAHRLDADEDGVVDAARRVPFDLVHVHDWEAIEAGIRASRQLDVPLVLSLHTTEHERGRPGEAAEAERIRGLESDGIEAADLVIVPHHGIRDQVVTLYEGPPDKVVIIPDIWEDSGPAVPDPAGERHAMGLDPNRPLALFAGEISHAAGADMLVDALMLVCRDEHGLQVVFAGEGPLKGELESRIWHGGLGDQVRFLGDVTADHFERLLVACDFVVQTARTWQGEGVAQQALAFGRPVLTTHQAHIHCVSHGQNGLIAHDNPNSVIWGLREMIANPMHNNMLRLLARRQADHARTAESVAAETYLAYEQVLGTGEEDDDDE